jgi:hypothetical protein
VGSIGREPDRPRAPRHQPRGRNRGAMAGGNVAPERRLVFGVGGASSQPARPRRWCLLRYLRWGPAERNFYSREGCAAGGINRTATGMAGIRRSYRSEYSLQGLGGRFKRALGLPWAAWSALPRRVISFDPFSRLHTDSSRTPSSVIGGIYSIGATRRLPPPKPSARRSGNWPSGREKDPVMPDGVTSSFAGGCG